MKNSRGHLPQDNLFRAVYALPSASEDDPKRAVTVEAGPGTGRTLDLQWSVFDQWTEISSAYEGHFMERIAPGAFTKTIAENRPNMRILLQHGRDPQLGNKPIAAISDVGENDVGGYARGELFPGLDPLVVDGLRAGQYGSSFRFGVIRDDFVQKPKKSDYNPEGIPERTIREATVPEFGPVTWGAYSAASAGVRSITDEIHFASLASIPEERLRELVAFVRGERVDAEDLNCIAQMILSGTAYIADQDESDESGNVDTMNEVLTLLSSLVEVEAAEVEPAEPEDEYNAALDSEGSAERGTDESRRTEAPVEEPAATATPATVARKSSQRKRYLPSGSYRRRK